MTEDLLKDFFTVLLERIRVYDYKLEIDSDIFGDHCEFSLYYQGNVIYNFWASLNEYRILVSDKFLVAEPRNSTYADTIDLALFIMDSMFPVLFKLGIVTQFTDLAQVVWGFKYHSWISFITHFLDDLGISYYNYDGMIRTDGSTVFIDERHRLFYTSVLGQEFYKEFHSDLDLQYMLLDHVRNLVDVSDLNVLTCQFVSPVEIIEDSDDLPEDEVSDEVYEEESSESEIPDV